MVPLVSSDAVKRQQENESGIIDGGIKRYRDHAVESSGNGFAAETRAGRWMMGRFIEPLSARIAQFVDDSLQKGKPGPGSEVARVLDRLDPDLSAFVAVKILQNEIFRDEPVSRANVSCKIGHAVSEELQFRHMKKEDSRAYKYWTEAMKRAAHRQTKHRCVVKLKDFYDNLPVMTRTCQCACGSILVHFVFETTGMIEFYRSFPSEFTNAERLRRKPTEYVRVTEAYRKELESMHRRAEALFPRYEPMVCPPKPWDSAYGCGFVGELGRRMKLIRTSNRSYLEEINNSIHKMPKVLSALNAIQATPYRINAKVLDVLNDAITAGGGDRYRLPAMRKRPYPPYDPAIKGNKELEKLWVGLLKPIQARNKKDESLRHSLFLVQELAEKYRNEPAIWFAHNLDWRGRVYPLATALSPQGDELSRSLLEFAEGMPLATDEAIMWLAIHGAGCWGYDKVSFADRMRWVEENQENILDAVIRPLDCLWWTGADKPWMFLAWCFEWAGYLREGKNFVSRLAVSMDGSCNGLQNFAAMLRHEGTARAVNLAPSETPNDIYQQVADLVKPKIEALAASDARTEEELLEIIKKRTDMEFTDDEITKEERMKTDALWSVISSRWIKDHITRKLVKRPVMTYPYSVTVFGMRKQIEELLGEMHNEGKLTYPERHDGKVSRLLTSYVYDAIRETVVAAAQAMEWLRDAADVVTRDEKPVTWISPIGMYIMQNYREDTSKCINTRIGGMRLQTRMLEPTKAINVRKQAAGIAPNFVHSCDASHLMFTVNACLTEGITDFQMIHDSYGTHARNAGALARILREQFIKMYGSQNVLAEFQAQLAQDVGSEIALSIPDSPAPGSFDLNQVITSKYFFA